jgi:molecular chaperone GrpE
MTEEKKRKDEIREPSERTDTTGKRLPAGDDQAVAAYRRQAEAAEAEQRLPEHSPGAEAAAVDAEARIAELKDLLLRKAAEFDNYRKRVERERGEFTRYATADIVKDILPVLDNLERALSVDAGDGAGEFVKGIELIHRQLLDTLERNGLEPINAVGCEFDPHVHEAVVHEPSAGHAEGEVIEELQRGYKLGGRVLRPAKVKVAAAPQGGSSDDGEDGPIEIPIQ